MGLPCEFQADFTHCSLDIELDRTFLLKVITSYCVSMTNAFSGIKPKEVTMNLEQTRLADNTWCAGFFKETLTKEWQLLGYNITNMQT